MNIGIIAQEYAARGWVPLPVRVVGEPCLKNGKPSVATGKEVRGKWKHIKSAAESLPNFNGKPSNIGVKTGVVSGDLVDIDLDCEETNYLAHYFLPPTEAIFGRKSTPQSYWLYQAGAIGNSTYEDPMTKLVGCPENTPVFAVTLPMKSKATVAELAGIDIDACTHSNNAPNRRDFVMTPSVNSYIPA